MKAPSFGRGCGKWGIHRGASCPSNAARIVGQVPDRYVQQVSLSFFCRPLTFSPDPVVILYLMFLLTIISRNDCKKTTMDELLPLLYSSDKRCPEPPMRVNSTHDGSIRLSSRLLVPVPADEFMPLTLVSLPHVRPPPVSSASPHMPLVLRVGSRHHALDARPLQPPLCATCLLSNAQCPPHALASFAIVFVSALAAPQRNPFPNASVFRRL
ncbi:hypothetical protein DFH09DRAFT_1366715, partial [Mycena vulgaris]